MISVVCLGILSGLVGASLGETYGLNRCLHYCQNTYYPVCASNGVTYANGCLLSEAACLYKQTGHTISIHHYGHCSMAETLASNRSCVDRICDEDAHYVCASDGNVYTNDCFYHMAACTAAQNGTHMFIVVYADTCPTPRKPDCDKYHANLTDLAIEDGSHVDIKYYCSSNGPKVCTSDSRTYQNECALCRSMDSNSHGSHHMHGFGHHDHNTDPDPAEPVQILYDGPCHGTLVHPSD